MTSEQTTGALRYHGQLGSQYLDIATRGTGEYLGLAINYAKHPSGIGCFIVRFVARGVEKASLKHLSYRSKANFCCHGGGTHKEILKGIRLNKVAIKAFDPAVYPHEALEYAEKMGTLDTLVEWVAEQVQSEGFMLLVDLKKEITDILTPPAAKKTEGEVKGVLEFPDLNAQEEKASALKESVSQEDDEDGDGDDDGEDEDGEEDEGGKGWLN